MPSTRNFDYEFRKLVGERLQTARESVGLTQEGVLSALGGSVRSLKSIQDWESGTSMPMVEKLPLLADLYQVTIDWILGRGYETTFGRVEDPDLIAVLEAEWGRMEPEDKQLLTTVVRAARRHLKVRESRADYKPSSEPDS